MPYLVRDREGKVTRISLQPVLGAVGVPFDNPDLRAFLEKNGQDPKKVDEHLAELRRTDNEMARAVEDLLMALLKKNLIKMTDLPKAVQDRMAFRVKLRMMIQESFDQASATSQTRG